MSGLSGSSPLLTATLSPTSSRGGQRSNSFDAPSARFRARSSSHRRRKQRRCVSRLHARVAHLRRNGHHDVAHRLVRRYGAFAVESLNLRGMVRNHRRARAVSDCAWAQFRAILGHKAESAGIRVIGVDPRGTSQECAACGQEQDFRLFSLYESMTV
jgi:putative transposase